jgi:transposase-like protein
MSTQRKHHSPEFKAKVAMEAIKESETLNQLSVKFDVHPNQIARWKKEAIEIMTEGFSQKKQKSIKDDEAQTDELFKQIGQLKVELDWIKKKSGISYRG